MRRGLFLAFLGLLTAGAALAQGPSADWQTLSTPHFRMHYPAASEVWARGAAARLESIRERVVAEVGYDPPEVVDVVVSDPVADANGTALPFLGWPRMILWTSPPGPFSEIGHYTDWSELLITHEETHLVHLLRPSRNPARQLLAKVIPVGPIVFGAPRWVFEGYATVVEGRLTGSGRPNGDLRAAILRRWAQGGKLPSYARLASDSGTWRGMSMAYLLGSAYLEWLEQRAGPGSLRNLWARMTARTPRDFADSFRGVFGDTPENLYDRFRAELTWRAMEAERQGGQTAEGELWQDLSWTVGAPALSPDGRKMAIVLGSRDRPARLVVWNTAPDEEAETKWRQRREEIQKRDPQDVPAVRTGPLPRKPLHTLESHDGPEPTTPRWMPAGRSILFVRFEPDTEGFLHPDLFLWTPENGEVRRLTRNADLRDPDPSPDGGWAVAVRHRDGFSQIVRVDLRTGEIAPLTTASAEEVHDRPRLSPDGRRVVYAVHRESSWRLAVLEVDRGEIGRETLLDLPAGATVSSPAWSADGRTIYAVAGLRGFVDLYAFPADGGPPEPLTRTQGAALAPTPTPDGSGLFFLSLQPDGFDLRRLPLPVQAAAVPPAPELPRELAPAVPPPPPPRPEPFARAEVAPGRPYGLGKQELFPLIGGGAASGGGVVELGVRGGDVIGRLDWLAFGSIGVNGWPAGEALAAAWRGWPVEVGAHLFNAGERPTETESVARRGNLLDLDRRGLELWAARDWRWSGGRFSLAGRGLWDQVSPIRRDLYLDQRLASLTGGWAGFRRWGEWYVQPGLAGHYEAGHTEEAGSWARWGGTARLGLGHADTRLVLTWRRDSSRDTGFAFDEYQLGGAETSLLPDSALSHRIFVPALPVGTRLGADHEGQRADLSLGFLPVPLFYERHRLWGPSTEPGSRDWLSLAGLEYRFNIGPLPVGRLPAFDVRVGVARILEDPFGEFEGSTRWWLTTVWKP